MEYTQAEILQTVRMTEMEHLDVRTVTLGLSLRDCVRATVEETAECVREKIERMAARLVPVVDEIGEELGMRIANKRISITPASLVFDRARSASELIPLARAIDEAAKRRPGRATSAGAWRACARGRARGSGGCARRRSSSSKRRRTTRGCVSSSRPQRSSVSSSSSFS